MNTDQASNPYRTPVSERNGHSKGAGFRFWRRVVSICLLIEIFSVFALFFGFPSIPAIVMLVAASGSTMAASIQTVRLFKRRTVLFVIASLSVSWCSLCILVAFFFAAIGVSETLFRTCLTLRIAGICLSLVVNDRSRLFGKSTASSTDVVQET